MPVDNSRAIKRPREGHRLSEWQRLIYFRYSIPYEEFQFMNKRIVSGISLLAACSVLLFPAISKAQAADPSNTGNNAVSADEQGMASQMVPAQAVLDKALDAKKAQKGEQFRATLTGKVQLKNGTELPRGTALVGTIATDSMQQYGAKSLLALRFTQAQLKDGKTIPIQATIVGVAAPATSDSWDQTSGGAPPDPWNGKAMQIDVVGVLSGVDLHSTIAGKNSGVFVSTKKDNMKLAAQSQLSLALTTESSGGASGGL
jgi:hypothetical protein